jgi:hypothetical protein
MKVTLELVVYEESEGVVPQAKRLFLGYLKETEKYL